MRISDWSADVCSSDLSAGTALLIDDGKLRLEVQDCTSSHAETRVVTGGPLRNHKGVNLPGVILPISPITEKDRIDLAFAIDLGAAWIALSFNIRRAACRDRLWQ